MVAFCRTAQCRTRVILDYFGNAAAEDVRCGHCDNDVAIPGEWTDGSGAGPGPVPARNPLRALIPGEEVSHGMYGAGVVLAVDLERAEVDFAGHGVRVLHPEALVRE
ncbi:MAG: RecQ family zinc-binding domain-containing protein [Gemmatimonadota bacterium]|nr:RecQ family zinc-binding domain-containing protein [Gemmatimonadota bacterium]